MVFKRCSIDTKGSKVSQENTPHTNTPPPTAWTIETRQDISMLSCSLRQILTLPSECRSRNRDSSDQATFFQSSIVQFWWSLCELYPPCPVLSWQERHPVWSSAAGAHLLQGSMCCVFRDGVLYTLVVTSRYLSYCCLSVNSNQSAHSPLTSTRHFHPHLTGYFLFFRPFSVNLEMVVCENPSRSAVCEILRPALLAPTTIPRSVT